MNSCGVQMPHILARFMEEDESEIQATIEEYYFSEWYPLVADICPTPKSFILPLASLDDGAVDRLIQTCLPGQKCFARLDTCSSKPGAPFRSSGEIRDSLASSDRTRAHLRDPRMKLVVREWLPDIHTEFRCFFHQGQFRAISTMDGGGGSAAAAVAGRLREILKTISFVCDYADFTADFCLCGDGPEPQLHLVEINTPVYLCATSGNFDLDVPFDYEVLLGAYQPDVLTYPVIR